MIVRELSVTRCAEIMTGNRIGRLACSKDDRPYVVPIFYVYADRFAYAFTMPGRKLNMLRANPLAALLVEERDELSGWRSVIAEGPVDELRAHDDDTRERDYAWSLLSRHACWWEPGALKPDSKPPDAQGRHVFFRLHVNELSGREGTPE